MQRTGWAALSPEWWDYRQNNLTSTDVAPIMGLGKYATPRSVWMRVTGRTELDRARSDSPDARWGTYSESVNAALYEVETGRHVSRAWFDGLVISDELPWFGATPDGLATDADGSKILWEAKAPRRWERGSTELRPDHFWQMVGGMFATGLDRASISVLQPPDVYWQDIARAVETEARMLTALHTFREKFWLPDVPPPVIALDEQLLRETYPDSEPRHVELPRELVEATWELPALEQAKKQTQEAIDTIKARVQDHMGTAEYAAGGDVEWTWRRGKRSRPMLWKIKEK